MDAVAEDAFGNALGNAAANAIAGTARAYAQTNTSKEDASLVSRVPSSQDSSFEDVQGLWEDSTSGAMGTSAAAGVFVDTSDTRPSNGATDASAFGPRAYLNDLSGQSGPESYAWPTWDGALASDLIGAGVPVAQLYGGTQGYGYEPVSPPYDTPSTLNGSTVAVTADVVPTTLETAAGFAALDRWATAEGRMSGLPVRALPASSPTLPAIEAPYRVEPGWAAQAQAIAQSESQNPGNTLLQRSVFAALGGAEYPLAMGEEFIRGVTNAPSDVAVGAQWAAAATLTDDPDARLTYIANASGRFGEGLLNMTGAAGLAESAVASSVLASRIDGVSMEGMTLSGDAGNYLLRSPVYAAASPGTLYAGLPIEVRNPLVALDAEASGSALGSRGVEPEVELPGLAGGAVGGESLDMAVSRVGAVEAGEGMLGPDGLPGFSGVPSSAIGNVKLGFQSLDPTTISFTQSSVSFAKAGASYDLDSLVASMSKDGWMGNPIDVVAMPDGTLASIDNTRVLAARMANIDVQANVRGFDELITDPVRQFSLTEAGVVPDTWGDAALLRINKPIQNATYPNMSPSWSTRFPYGSLYDPEVK